MAKTTKEFLQAVWALCEAILSRDGMPDDIRDAAEEIQQDVDRRFDELTGEQ